MREAIGGTWIFSIVIVFIVLFTGYLAVSVNYSRAFKVKSNIVSIIEQHEGLNDGAEAEIDSYLSGIGYAVYGTCAEGETGFNENLSGSKAMYCVSKRSNNADGALNKSYYRVKVWFRLDLPIFGDLFTFPVTGETKAVHFANDNL